MKICICAFLLLISGIIGSTTLKAERIQQVYDYADQVSDRRPFSWYYPYSYQYYYPRRHYDSPSYSYRGGGHQCFWIYTRNGYVYQCY